MGSELKALERVRPGLRFTLPATINNVAQPGQVIAFTVVASTEGGLQTFRFQPTSQGGGLPPDQFVSCKLLGAAGALAYLAFGDATLPATTTGNAPLEAADSWQDFQLNPGDTCFRTLGGAVGGTLYILFSGR